MEPVGLRRRDRNHLRSIVAGQQYHAERRFVLQLADVRAWAANAQDGTLSVVDPVHAREIHRSTRLCGFPIAMDIGRNSLLWLACFGSSELIAIGRDDYTPIRRWRLSSAPLNIAVHPHAELAYLSVPRANAIDEIDLVTGEVIRRIPVGIEPDGLRWAERPALVR
jgi:hypothetical protein